jgi:hypothetical protein
MAVGSQQYFRIVTPTRLYVSSHNARAKWKPFFLFADGYSTETLVMRWHPKPVETAEGLQLPQFELENITEYICDVTYAGGTCIWSIDLLHTVTEQLSGHIQDNFTCQYQTHHQAK